MVKRLCIILVFITFSTDLMAQTERVNRGQVIASYLSRENFLSEHQAVCQVSSKDAVPLYRTTLAVSESKLMYLRVMTDAARLDGSKAPGKEEMRAIFDGSETMLRYDETTTRFFDGNRLQEMQILDYFTAYNGCAVFESDVTPIRRTFPAKSLRELLNDDSTRLSSASGKTVVSHPDATISLDNERNFAVEQIRLPASASEASLQIDASDFVELDRGLWFAKRFDVFLGGEPGITVDVESFSRSVDDGTFTFVIKPGENIEDIRPYDGLEENAVVVFRAPSDPADFAEALSIAIEKRRGGIVSVRPKSAFRNLILVANFVLLALVAAIYLRKRFKSHSQSN